MLNLISIIKGLLVQNDTDRTKEVAIEADVASTTGTRTTIKAKQTANRSIDLPDADDTLVGKATTDTLTNKTLTSPVINSPTGIVKGDVGLGNVDNTSDATKDAAAVSLTNKTIDGTAATGTNSISADASNITLDPAPSTLVSTTAQTGFNEVAGRLDATETLVTAAATKQLDNLNNVAINTGINPAIASDGLLNLGETGRRWNQVDGEKIIGSNIDVRDGAGSGPRLFISSDGNDSQGNSLAGKIETPLVNQNLGIATQQTGNNVDLIGSIFVETGRNTGGANANPTGKVEIRSGEHTGPGNSGNILIKTGPVNTGTRGNITLDAGLTTVLGNLDVTGTTTTVNTATLDVTDKNITVNKTGNDASSEGAGLTVERTGTDGSFIYEDALASKFKLGALGAEKEIVDVSSSQTVTNKIINTSDVDLSGAAATTNRIVASSETTANLNALARKKGAVYFDDTSNTYKGDNGTSLIDLGGSGSGGINHITNPDFEIDASDWALYNDGAVADPVDGTGGTPSGISLARTAVVALVVRGDGSLQLIKDGGSKQGQGFSTDFSVDNVDVGKKLNVSFEYSAGAVGYVSGDIAVFVYDVDNLTLLGRVYNDDDGDVLPTANTNTQSKFQGQFYATDSLNYRLIFHIATANTNTFGMILDNVKVSPEEFAPGAIVTKPAPFVPTWAGLTVGNGTIRSANYWREGSFMVGEVNFVLGSTSSVSAIIRMDIPDSKVIDTDITPTGFLNSTAGYGSILNVNLSNQKRLVKLYPNSSTQIALTYWDASGVQTDTGSAAPAAWTTNDNINIIFKVPIVGWSASNLISTTEALFRNVSVQTSRATTGITLPAATITKLVFNSNIRDDFNTFNTTTGEFTAPKSGVYSIVAALSFSAGTGDGTLTSYLYVNGVNRNNQLGSMTGTKAGGMVVAFKIFLNKGDVVDIRINPEVATALLSGASISGGSQLFIDSVQDESVYGVYGETELVEATSSLIAFPFGANLWGDLTSVSLSAGEWDIDIQTVYYSGAGITTGEIAIGTSSTPGNVAPGIPLSDAYQSIEVNTTTNRYTPGSFFKKGIIVTDTTTYYLKALATDSVTNLQVSYKISARRIK